MTITLRKAFALSSEEVADATPPGTTILFSHNVSAEVSRSEDEIQLIPRPSADPADPLNLPQWRKIAMLAVMSIHPFVVNITISSISSVLPIYASSPIFGMPPKSFAQLTYFVAVNNLTLGASNLIWVPLANTFGRRPIVLLSLLLLVLSSMWAAFATTFNGLLAARAVMGIGGGPADAVSPDVLGEIFFVHQRGRAMAIYTIFLVLGSLVGGLIGGYVESDLGLTWIHWLNVVLSAITFVLCLVFQAETLYERSQTTAVFRAEDKPGTELKEAVTRTASVSPVSYQPYTYARSVRLWTYRPGIVDNFTAPFRTLRLPGTWLVALWYAGLVALIVTLASVGPQLVAASPYLWGRDVGLISVGAIIGAFLGCVYTYLVADWSTRRAAIKDSHGFFEPESRLSTALPALFIAVAGSLIFGFVGQNASPNGWIGLQFGYGMVAFGLMQAPSVGFNYLIDAYGPLASDCFVAVTAIRSLVSFAWTFFIGEWISSRGTAEPFGIFALLLSSFAFLTFPIIIWGKNLRIWTAKWVPDGFTE